MAKKHGNQNTCTIISISGDVLCKVRFPYHSDVCMVFVSTVCMHNYKHVLYSLGAGIYRRAGKFQGDQFLQMLQ